MDVKIEHKQKMVLIGFSSHIAPDEGYEKCPEFWDKEYNARFAHLWQTGKLENPVECAVLANRIGMFAICSCTKNGFDYWIAGIYQGGDVPDGLKLFTFQESDWAIFFLQKDQFPVRFKI